MMFGPLVFRVFVVMMLLFSAAGCAHAPPPLPPLTDYEMSGWETVAGKEFLSVVMPIASSANPVYFEGIDVRVVKEAIGYAVSKAEKSYILGYKGYDKGLTVMYLAGRPYVPGEKGCPAPSDNSATKENLVVMELCHVRALETREYNFYTKKPGEIGYQVRVATILARKDLLKEAGYDTEYQSTSVLATDRIGAVMALIAEAKLGNSTAVLPCRGKVDAARDLSALIRSATIKHHRCSVEKRKFEVFMGLQGKTPDPALMKKNVKACADDPVFTVPKNEGEGE